MYSRTGKGKLNASPWAVKKINSKCATKQKNIYQERLNEEAKLLKEIDHPNIVGEMWRCTRVKKKKYMNCASVPFEIA